MSEAAVGGLELLLFTCRYMNALLRDQDPAAVGVIPLDGFCSMTDGASQQKGDDAP